MHAHGTRELRPPRRALPLLLLAALLALGGASWAGLAPRPAAAVTPGKNGRIAAMRSDGAGAQIVTMTAKGKRARQVTNGTRDLYPRWSPSGDRIVFVLGGDIWTMQPDGSNQQVLAAGSAEQTYYRLACSPDGKRVLAAVIDNTTDIWSLQTVPSAGGAPKVVKGTYSNKVRYLISDPDWQTLPRKGSQRVSAKPDRDHDRTKHDGRRKPGR